MATPPTGRPRGRPRGARNKRTQAAIDAGREMAKAIGAAIPQAFEGDAHAFLMTVYRDPTQDIALRIDAAKAAVRYEKPALSSVEAKVAMTLEDLDETALDAEIRKQQAVVGLIASAEPTAH